MTATKHYTTGALALLLALALIFAPGRPVDAQATAPTATHSTSPAWFDGHWIDLSKDWEGAIACDIAVAGSVCFHSEAEMDQYLTVVESMKVAQAVTATCSSALRLYTGTSYTGTVLNLSTEFSTINLSTYGFDNVTSSYKVGACDADFYSAANLAGTLYPGNTSANVWSTTMLSGWNNVISSVYIY